MAQKANKQRRKKTLNINDTHTESKGQRGKKANILKWHIMATDKRRENEQTNECLGYAYYPKCTEFFHIKATISFSIKWNIKRTSLNR